MGQSQYLVYSSKSSIFEECISLFRFWYISKCYRFLKSVLSFSKPQHNFKIIKMSRILLSINLNFDILAVAHIHPIISPWKLIVKSPLYQPPSRPVPSLVFNKWPGVPLFFAPFGTVDGAQGGVVGNHIRRTVRRFHLLQNSSSRNRTGQMLVKWQATDSMKIRSRYKVFVHKY